MEKYSYFREQYSIMTQFVAAFDNCFVYRFDKSGVAKEKIAVRYINGSKQRALFDIVNPAKNITLPAISINRKNLKRDSNRIQYKDQNMYRPHINDKNVSKIPLPVPVSCDVDVSIIANYKEDIDQIVSNFIPWCNPYFIISWKIPEEFGMDFIDELRSEVSWSGSIDYEEPIDVDKSEKHRVIANTSFTIKGWIFPSMETPEAPIYTIKSNFVPVSTGEEFTYASNLSDYSLDTINISAFPEITNEFVNGRPYYSNINIESSSENVLTLYGKRFNFNNYWYLSGTDIGQNLEFVEIDTAKYPKISAYKLPSEAVEVVNDNISVVTLSTNFLSSGNFTLVTSNSAGWVSSNHNILVI